LRRSKRKSLLFLKKKKQKDFLPLSSAPLHNLGSRTRLTGTARSRASTDMNVAYISALSALAGSVIGGLTSGTTSWLNQRSLARAEQLGHERSRQ
jgi:hypothetical protein